MSAIYVLDETGQPLPNFPVRLPSTDSIAYLNLVDYNKTKAYRFFVSDVRGRAYVLDKRGNPLPGWSPNSLRPLAEAPFHVRLGQRDCMVLPQDDGILHMYRRIGASYPNFPVRVGMRFAGKLYLERGATLAGSHFVALNTQGERLQVTLTGQIKERTPLYPTLGPAVYQLVPSVTGKGYVFVAQDAERLVVLSATGTLLFEKAAFLSEDFSVHYYNLGGQRSVLAFYAPQQGQVYFYATNGTEIMPSPVPASHSIALTYSRSPDSYTLYLHQEDKHVVLRHTMQ